jgi:50S ribosomal protein L16 3-hydroxylase
MRYHGKMKKFSTLPHTSEQSRLLGGISPERFLSEYWQKKPLLIRGAIPGFDGLLAPDELAGLACEEDAQSRLVSHAKDTWKLEHGPFDEARFASLPKKDWTLLVQGVNHHLPEASALLSLFNFIPHARLDDLMVSFAPDGGGVGPHFDSYDVFLLQGQGKRLWRISQQKDLSLVEGAPLRILKQFEVEEEFLLEAGDMLYLPPHIAHWGIAVGECMTYSIGFRAPSAKELTQEFLSFLLDDAAINQALPHTMYADPDLALQAHPAEIGSAMVNQVASMLAQLSWQPSDVSRFLGKYLTEPKPGIIFDVPRKTSLHVFAVKAQRQGIQLALKSQMLFDADYVYINGEQYAPGAHPALLMSLADTRLLAPEEVATISDESLMAQLHAWYSAGYLTFPD